MFFSQWHITWAIYSSRNYGRSLVLSDLTNIPRLISLYYVPTPLLIRFNNWTWKLSFRQPYFKIACVKSVLWPALISNCVNASLSGVSLGYWTACNNFKRYCTFPYCFSSEKYSWFSTFYVLKNQIWTCIYQHTLAMIWFNDIYIQKMKWLTPANLLSSCCGLTLGSLSPKGLTKPMPSWLVDAEWRIYAPEN